MNYKKRLIILVGSIIIYLVITFVYNSVNSHDYKEVFVLKKDVLRGEILYETDFEKISLNENNTFFTETVFVSNEIQNYVSTKDLSKGCILLKEDIVEKSQYNKANKDLEIISIKISNPDDVASYQIEKNSVVNLYYTGKLGFAKDILEDINLPYVSTKTESINKVDSEYITIKLIENIKVIDLFDKYGNVIGSNNYVKNESNKIDTIMFEIKKDLVMKINNLKNYGQFSISVVR